MTRNPRTRDDLARGCENLQLVADLLGGELDLSRHNPFITVRRRAHQSGTAPQRTLYRLRSSERWPRHYPARARISVVGQHNSVDRWSAVIADRISRAR